MSSSTRERDRYRSAAIPGEVDGDLLARSAYAAAAPAYLLACSAALAAPRRPT